MVFEYLGLSITLLLLLTLFIRTAARYQLVDTANDRSSHTFPTIRGGGFVIPLSVLLYAVFFDEINAFTIGLLLITIVSFWDDIKSLPNRWRLLIQLTSVVLLVHHTIGFSELLIVPLIAVIVLLGSINAVNFMDGVNGITVAFGTVTLVSLIYLNTTTDFMDQRLLNFSLIGVLALAFFNFRKRAKCFAGDVGSITLGFILAYFTLLFFQYSGDVSVVVLWTVYGVDSVLTIVNRILKKENIFIAHRTHLYQYLANELGQSHLLVATLYGTVQGLINVLFVVNFYVHFMSPMSFTALILIFSGITYLYLRKKVVSKVKSATVINES